LNTHRKNRSLATKPANRPYRKGLDVATASLREESELLIGILETLSQSRNIDEYLEQLVQHLKKYSGCRCIGIRLLDGEGNIPYTSYDGFSQEFYESENPLSLKNDKCMCINVINGATDPSLPFYTDGGSFLSNGTTRLLASVPDETKGQTRNVCNQYGYESVALVPMKHKGRILGLIHLADESENKIPEERVRFLERVGAYISEALHTFMSEEALQESEEKYRAVFNEARDGVVLVDFETGHISDCNPEFESLTGRKLEQLKKMKIWEIRPPEKMVAAEEKFLEVREKGEGGSAELEFQKPDGEIVLIELKSKAVIIRGRQYLQSVARDVTERKRLDQLKDEFIGLVSHELRSPLTVVIGAVNTALTEAERLSAEETRQLLQDAASEAESLSHLLGNLLELSRVQADRLFLHVEPTSIENAAQNAVEQIRRQSPTHQFVIDLPQKLPLIPADQLRVERILYNLLGNAVNYSPQGGDIRVFAKPENERLVIGVSDQGIGISPQDQAKLFEPFQRLEDSRLYVVKGIGLGLLVCRRLVEAHGGQIWVESEPGLGTTFFFTLPLRQTTQH